MESSHPTLPWSQVIRAAQRHHRILGVDARADVVIVGAGITGMTTALMLARNSVDVVVLDDGPIGGGETERTTAHLSSALDDGFVMLERNHGVEGSKLAFQSHATAIDVIETIVEEEGIDCSFSRLDGWLFCAAGHTTQRLQDELDACRRAGFVDVEMHDRAPELMWDTGACLRFPRQGQLHPLKYLQGLTDAFLALGGRIHTSTHVAHVEGGPHPFVRTTNGRIVHASAVVVATNTPVNDRFVIHTKQQAWRSYVVALRLDDVVRPMLLWDTGDPYHYVRTAEGTGPGGTDLLIVGGEDHRTGQANDADERWARLHHWAFERFPVGNIVHRWSGQIIEPVDGLAFIGKNPGGPDNVYIATGDSGHGMTHGTIAGMILSSLVRGQDHPWAALYEPSRKPAHALGEYALENLESVSHYAQYVLPADVEDVDDIGRGQGAIVREGLTLYAVSCNEQGMVRKCSAVCPHLGGIVAWNAAERSWDCPVHGSRFDVNGVVVSGPANTNLKQIDQPQPETVVVDESLKLA
ncbi:MAG: FAD-dependent oxidoreductase [Deltaproteobacteria bacterium]|nr:FAD-dependent oxidoreductase [Deltaproteobacteria bacterium]